MLVYQRVSPSPESPEPSRIRDSDGIPRFTMFHQGTKVQISAGSRRYRWSHHPLPDTGSWFVGCCGLVLNKTPHIWIYLVLINQYIPIYELVYPNIRWYLVYHLVVTNNKKLVGTLILVGVHPEPIKIPDNVFGTGWCWHDRMEVTIVTVATWRKNVCHVVQRPAQSCGVCSDQTHPHHAPFPVIARHMEDPRR